MDIPITTIATPVISAGQVAQLLGLSQPIFRKRRLGLEAAGFPPKLPGLNGWSRAAVLRWIEINGATFDPVPRLDAIVEEARALEREYA